MSRLKEFIERIYEKHVGSNMELEYRTTPKANVLAAMVQINSKPMKEEKTAIPLTKEEPLTIEEKRKFVYFIEDTHPAKVAKWFGTEFEPDTSWTEKMACWTDNPTNALQFKTLEEAEIVRKELNIDGHIVTEHEFVNNNHVDKSQNCQSEVEKKETDVPEQIDMVPMDFVEWYSGMDRIKIKRAYLRWEREIHPEMPIFPTPNS